jgi:hypothetical protein
MPNEGAPRSGTRRPAEKIAKRHQRQLPLAVIAGVHGDSEEPGRPLLAAALSRPHCWRQGNARGNARDILDEV